MRRVRTTCSKHSTSLRHGSRDSHGHNGEIGDQRRLVPLALRISLRKKENVIPLELF
jgi:hypothetical protein